MLKFLKTFINIGECPKVGFIVDSNGLCVGLNCSEKCSKCQGSRDNCTVCAVNRIDPP